MNGESTLTARGMIAVPREICERLGLKAGDKVSFSIMSKGPLRCAPKLGASEIRLACSREMGSHL